MFRKIINIKTLSLLPMLLLLCVIFGFSAQDGDTSGSLSFKISLFVVKLFSPFLPAALSDDVLFDRAEMIHLLIRKAAHMTEYFLLLLSIHLPLRVYLKSRLSFKIRLLIAFLCTVLLAAADEFHQTLVPGRSGNITDVGIDSIGALIATLALLFISMLISKRKKSTL